MSSHRPHSQKNSASKACLSARWQCYRRQFLFYIRWGGCLPAYQTRRRRTAWIACAAQLLGHASFAHAPGWFTTAPVTAAKKLLGKIGWQIKDVDLWEVNEAFAVVPMAFMRELDISHDIVNIHGGACALGHPIGASGARIIVTLLNALEVRGKKRGLAAICLGGGEGIAVALERP